MNAPLPCPAVAGPRERLHSPPLEEQHAGVSERCEQPKTSASWGVFIQIDVSRVPVLGVR